MRRFVLFVAIALSFAAGARADAPRFRFHKGETLAYHLVQTTRITETVPDDKTGKPVETEVLTKADLTRHWKVADVDANGVATLEMSIVAMRWERKAGKDEDVFDSSKPDDLNKTEMAKHVGPVLAVLRIDPQGRLVEVKESKVGPAARFAGELPFKVTLPDAEPKVGETWDRTYTIQLDPPLGTGEKYAASQRYACLEPKGGFLTVGLTTSIKDMPTQAAEQIPLLSLTPEGTLYFHAPSGRYYGARLKAEKELKNHQGEGSKYRFVSTYVEDLVPAK
ncbi:MAG: hypothetical protein J2P46_04455 [Zavarzinella sp.]|nr:hypothetical protein [Zavarzinella sp.]